MTGSPLVSVIIPVHNGESFLAEAVQSVLTQTLRPLEILVVDDGSTDQTLRVAQTFGDQVRYLYQENAGPAAARNTGLAEACGSLLAFVDADDLWVEHKLERQVEVLTVQSDVDYVVSNVQNFWIEDLASERESMRSHPRSRPVAGYVTGTLLARRSVFEAAGVFDTKLGHGDAADWFIRARDVGAREVLLEEVLLLRRLHLSNRSRLMAGSSREEFLLLLKNSLDRRRRGGGKP